MEVLTNESYTNFDRLSRYNGTSYFFNTLDDKYIQSITQWLSQETPYTLHTVSKGDTIDNIALKYYDNPTYFWIICDYNRINDPFLNLQEGDTIKVPDISSLEFINY